MAIRQDCYLKKKEKEKQAKLKTISCQVVGLTYHLCSGKRIRSSRQALGLGTALTTCDCFKKKKSDSEQRWLRS